MNNGKDGCAKAVQIFFAIIGAIFGAGLGAFVSYGLTGSFLWGIVGTAIGAILGGVALWHAFDPDLQGIGY